ncbi:hypothetical protein ruthe_00059 [Rubellimicrobium thermophilum DSM 16684]|uniref:Uncharacterized protein n=1 Tax=Rubellimicrobium thermophilum DSM 16684 TaxID=1123069 RepID=S9SN34_9RHOB|nr:hypothetical protein ruthe_00059 [Rubellimicrobium thermophilum DSM 16684]
MAGVGDGNGLDQAAGIGMAWIAEDLFPAAHLDDLAQIHHRHAVGDGVHHRHVVRDEQVGQPAFGLQVAQQGQNPRLHRDVEGRDALIGDDQLGVEGKGTGDADALALAAREFVRVAVERLPREAHTLEQLGGAFAPLGRGAEAVDDQRFGHQIARAHAGIERSRRVLEHELGIPSHGTGDVALALQPAAGDPDLAREGDEAGDGLGDGGFAAARFADKGKGLAPADGQRHPLDGMDAVGGPAKQPAPRVEAHHEIAQHEDGRRPGGGRVARRRRAGPHPGHRGQQGAGIGRGRRGEDLPDGALLDAPAVLHHQHAVGHLGHDAHVMGDEDRGPCRSRGAGRAADPAPRAGR